MLQSKLALLYMPKPEILNTGHTHDPWSKVFQLGYNTWF